MSTTDIFVGRKAEIAVLDAALNDTQAGRGRVVMLAGSPGIGKTRLADEFTELAQTRGALALRAACLEAASAEPYWVWS